MKRSLVLVLPLLLAACAGGRGSWNGSVQCAPYAREHSAVNLRGAAASWWGEAQGQYNRTSSPCGGCAGVSIYRQAAIGPCFCGQTGAKFPPCAGGSRKLGAGEVTHRAPVVDVSPNNNWTRVRVWWSPIHAMGKTVYPVYGFIEPTGTGGS